VGSYDRLFDLRTGHLAGGGGGGDHAHVTKGPFERVMSKQPEDHGGLKVWKSKQAVAFRLFSREISPHGLGGLAPKKTHHFTMRTYVSAVRRKIAR
jgi:hypothetical protein